MVYSSIFINRIEIWELGLLFSHQRTIILYIFVEKMFKNISASIVVFLSFVIKIPADSGRLARETCPADLPCSLARQSCYDRAVQSWFDMVVLLWLVSLYSHYEFWSDMPGRLALQSCYDREVQSCIDRAVQSCIDMEVLLWLVSLDCDSLQ
jgi:hypothetical protein